MVRIDISAMTVHIRVNETKGVSMLEVLVLISIMKIKMNIVYYLNVTVIIMQNTF